MRMLVCPQKEGELFSLFRLLIQSGSYHPKKKKNKKEVALLLRVTFFDGILSFQIGKRKNVQLPGRFVSGGS